MKTTKRLIIVLLCVALLAGTTVVFSACAPEDNPAQETITLDKTECTVFVDEELYLTVTTDAKGSITWTSSDKSIASVDSNGRILTKQVGVVTVTASIDDISASCKLIVVESVQQNSAKLLVDDTVFLSLKDGATKISVKYVDEENSGINAQRTITYTSSDQSVVTVSSDGTLTPVSLGTAVILVQCDGLVASVVADVYTAGISTAQEWLDMITNSGHYPEKTSTNERFYLKNDIDFAGVTYDIGHTAYGTNSENDNAYHFCSEVNGNYHAVKNITDWAADAETNPENHQSIFGRTIGATVKNIAFQNIVFNSAYSCGLTSSLLHHFSDGQTGTNLFENVSADFTYDFDATDGKGQFAVGVTRTAYGTNLKNVFIHMHAADDTKLLTDMYDKVYGFASAEYVWYGGSLSNVIIFMEDVPAGEATFTDDSVNNDGFVHSKTNCYAVDTLIQAVYYANKCFDKTIWSVISPDRIPSFIKR